MNVQKLDSLSTRTLRSHARQLGWRVRYQHNWNGFIGDDGFMIFNSPRNYPVVAWPLEESELRESLINLIDAEEYAS